MKTLIRLLFRALRLVLTPFILLWEQLARPRGVVRDAAAQREIDRQCASLALYQFRSCPFCIKVRREIARLSLNIELRDAQQEGPHRAALVEGGGKPMVPCLRITDEQGNSQWMYESADIIQHLRKRFGRP